MMSREEIECVMWVQRVLPVTEILVFAEILRLGSEYGYLRNRKGSSQCVHQC